MFMTPLLSDRPGRCPIPPVSSLCLCLQTLLSMLETVRLEEQAGAADPQSASGGGPLPAEVSVQPAAAARLFRRRTVSGGIPRQIDQWFTPSHFLFRRNLAYRVLLCPEDDSGIVWPERSTVPEI